jgi:hypothetical protein
MLTKARHDHLRKVDKYLAVTVDYDPLNYRQALTSSLYFRQCEPAKIGKIRESQPPSFSIIVDSWQGISSQRGKETLQVTTITDSE